MLDLVEGRREWSRAEAARQLGCTPEAVRLAEHRALKKLYDNPAARPVLRALLEQMAGDDRPGWSLELLGDPGEKDVAPPRELTPEEESAQLDAWASRVLELMGEGLSLRRAWAKANREESKAEDSMAKGKSKKNGKRSEAELIDDVVQNGAMRTRPEETVLGKPFTGRHPVTIDQVRRDKVSEELVAVLGDIDEVNEEKSAANGSFNTRLKELREKQHELAEAHRTSKEKQDVKCQQYLTRQNEVLVRRLDTNEIVERRTATPEELETLQVPMFDGAQAQESA